MLCDVYIWPLHEKKVQHFKSEIERDGTRTCCQVWFLLLCDFIMYIGNAVQLITVSKILFKISTGCDGACLCINFTYF